MSNDSDWEQSNYIEGTCAVFDASGWVMFQWDSNHFGWVAWKGSKVGSFLNTG